MSQYGDSAEFRKTEELAKAAFALQELRYLASEAIRRWDGRFTQSEVAEAMEAMRSALPTEAPSSGKTE